MPARLRHRNLEMSALRPPAPPSSAALTGGKPVALPQSWQFEKSWIERIGVPAPTAGVTSVDVRNVPGDAWERLRALRVQYVTDANAANRLIELRFRDAQSGGNIMYGAITPINMVASLTHTVNFGMDVTTITTVAQNNQQVALPDIILAPGQQIRMQFISAQAGDQASLIFLLLERWRSHRAWQAAR